MAGVDFNDLALGPCVAVFGVPAIYQPGAGAPVSLTGIFNEYATAEKIDARTGEKAVVTRPVLTIQQSAIASGMQPVQSEGIVVAGRTWKIVESLPDGMGAVVLRLMRAQTA